MDECRRSRVGRLHGGPRSPGPIDTTRTLVHLRGVPDRPSQRPYNVSYYRRNREREIDRVMTRQRATLEFLRELRKVPCKDCGGIYLPHQMDFDHRDPAAKSFGLTWPRALLASRERLAEEIAKCDVVCASCHAVRTYVQQAERWARRRADGELAATPRALSRRRRALPRRDFILLLRTRPCYDCAGIFPPYIMQFDHRDPAQKSFNVASSWCRSQAAILEEANKCDIVCPNCHRQRSFQRRGANAGVAQLARAAAFQAAGRGFEPRLPLRIRRSDDVRRQRLVRRLVPPTSHG